MKLVCIYDTTTKKKGIPLVNRIEIEEKIQGITKGKSYTVIPFSDVDGSTTRGTGGVSTYLRFLVFNDDKEWKTYHTNCFAPEYEK